MRDFFARFHAENPFPEGDPGLAIFARGDDGFAFVGDAYVPTGKSGLFRKTAPKGLCRSGACGFIRLKLKDEVRDRVLAISDERNTWFKPFPAGLAHWDEGEVLRETFFRELWEEAWLFDHIKRSAQYVPPGGKPRLECRSLGIVVKETVEVGELRELPLFFNEPEQIVTFHMEWDISALDISAFSVWADEDWYLGGVSGIQPVVIGKDGKVGGWFAGQQGFVAGPTWNLHPGVEDYVSRL